MGPAISLCTDPVSPELLGRPRASQSNAPFRRGCASLREGYGGSWQLKFSLSVQALASVRALLGLSPVLTDRKNTHVKITSFKFNLGNLLRTAAWETASQCL